LWAEYLGSSKRRNSKRTQNPTTRLKNTFKNAQKDSEINILEMGGFEKSRFVNFLDF
jgi:hypothetical protein